MNDTVKKLAEKQAQLCKLFGNTSRILIVWCLSDRELPVSEIADEVGTSLQNISQHLSLLREHGIVCARRDGQTIYYRISDDEWVSDCLVLLKASRHTLVEQ
jgi:ArsR family transcriptional regulator, virulence genes transcriptional regulator